MNENINLTEILKDIPKGTKLYSPLYGEVKFEEIKHNFINISIKDNIRVFDSEGFAYDKDTYPDQECLLFPSRDQRDWSKFKTKQTVYISVLDYMKGSINIYKQTFEVIGNNYDLSWQVENFVNAKYTEGCDFMYTEKDPEINIDYFSDNPSQIPDKALVWCWDDKNTAFYDARNKCVFNHFGKRNGFSYDNYELYKGEYPDWAKEALKTLED